MNQTTTGQQIPAMAQRTPNVEVLIVRDPDGPVDVTLFLDGVEVSASDISCEQVDAGAGWQIEDWREHTQAVQENPEYSQAFKKLVVAARVAHEDSPHIVGEATAVWTFFGHWEDDRIVMDLVLPGEHEDTRQADDEKWPEGLWCDTGRGADVDEARADAVAGYES